MRWSSFQDTVGEEEDGEGVDNEERPDNILDGGFMGQGFLQDTVGEEENKEDEDYEEDNEEDEEVSSNEVEQEVGGWFRLTGVVRRALVGWEERCGV